MSKIKELRSRFEATLKEVSDFLQIPISDITRDDYVRICVDNDIQDRLNKEELEEIGGFKSSKKLILPPEKTREQIQEEQRLAIKESYVSYVNLFGITPTIKIINSWGYTIKDIRIHFKSMISLYKECSTDYPEIFNELVNDTIFTEKYYNELKAKIKDSKRFLITTAVSGKPVNEKALEALKVYAKNKKAQILILPCEDVASRGSIFKYELDKRLRDLGFVFKDLKLNSNVHVSSIAVSAKQINPLTGLDRLAQGKGSAILASPKQYLKFVSTSNIKLPHALMTTGAITVNDYSTDKAMSQRTSYLAEFDHVLGAIVVEIENNDVFHFRQVQFDTDGSFYDLGEKFTEKGLSKVKESVCVFGDTHVGSHDLEVNKKLKEITKLVSCKEVIVHDIFDNRFNNHHDTGKFITRAKLAKSGKTNLMKEAEITSDWLNDWTNRVNKVTIVKSNHDEALDKYINEGRWLYDPENLYDSIDLVKAMMDGKDLLRYLLETKTKLKSPNKINWLKRDEDYQVYGIESGSHGDKGANGSKGTLGSIEKSYFKATIGHSHTAGILRNIYQVGTSTYMKLGYNSGPSSWTNTMCIQYPNGQRQLINIIKNKNGQYSYKI